MIGNRSVWGGDLQGCYYIRLPVLIRGIGFRRLTAGAMGINGAMIHVFKKLGFKEGVSGIRIEPKMVIAITFISAVLRRN